MNQAARGVRSSSASSWACCSDGVGGVGCGDGGGMACRTERAAGGMYAEMRDSAWDENCAASVLYGGMGNRG